jgi:hypothetical protein
MELRICREHGISHSHFLGGKAAWTDLDRDKAKALALLTSEECPDCHTLREDWLDEQGYPLAEPVWTTTLRSCPGCDALSTARDRMTEDQRRSGCQAGLMPLVDYKARA